MPKVYSVYVYIYINEACSISAHTASLWYTYVVCKYIYMFEPLWLIQLDSPQVKPGFLYSRPKQPSTPKQISHCLAILKKNIFHNVRSLAHNDHKNVFFLRTSDDPPCNNEVYVQVWTQFVECTTSPNASPSSWVSDDREDTSQISTCICMVACVMPFDTVCILSCIVPVFIYVIRFCSVVREKIRNLRDEQKLITTWGPFITCYLICDWLYEYFFLFSW